MGYRYVNEMESFLRAGLESSVLDAALALAGALHGRSDLIQPDPDATGAQGRDVYAYLLGQPMQIDGYVDDWRPYLHLMRPIAGGEPDLEGAAYLLGKHGAHLYALVRVVDDVVVLGAPQLWGERHADHVLMSIVDAERRLHRYLLTTPSPGWVTAYELSNVVDLTDETAPRRPGLRAETRIRAGWQVTSTGFDVELRIPLSLVGHRFSLQVGDIDHPHAAPALDPRSSPPPPRLVLPSSAIEALVKGMAHTPGRRFWVVDRQGRVLARGGSLELEASPAASNRLLALLLSPPSVEAFSEAPVVGRLGGKEIEAALAGQPSSRWGAVANSNTFVVSAASPIWNAGTVVGAVVVEQSSVGIQTVRRQALASCSTRPWWCASSAACFCFGSLPVSVRACGVCVTRPRTRSTITAAWWGTVTESRARTRSGICRGHSRR